MPETARRERIHSLDGVKGFMSLKIAFSHLGFFVAVPWLAHAVSLGRSLGFPILLFAFGVGTGISKRRKVAWPLAVLAVAMLAGSVLNETFMDVRAANGIPGAGTAMAGDALARLAVVASLTGMAHYADFLLPYLLFLSVSIFVDRLGKPIRAW